MERCDPSCRKANNLMLSPLICSIVRAPIPLAGTPRHLFRPAVDRCFSCSQQGNRLHVTHRYYGTAPACHRCRWRCSGWEHPVTLDIVIEAFREGVTAEAIVEQYPSLQLAEVYSVIGYYLRHQAKIDAYLQERARFASQIRQDNEVRFNPIGVRDRLLARRKTQG
jgi:Protein of unknown function (DUF433)